MSQFETISSTSIHRVIQYTLIIGWSFQDTQLPYAVYFGSDINCKSYKDSISLGFLHAIYNASIGCFPYSTQNCQFKKAANKE